MQFGECAVSEAQDAILAHSLRVGDRLLRKGHVLSGPDIEALTRAGRRAVTVARLEPPDIDENSAARRLGEACAGAGVCAGAAFAGRVNLYANLPGVALIDAGIITRLNTLDESITVATLQPFARVASRQMLATIKIIPFAAPRTAVDAAERLVGSTHPLRVAPFAARSVALISTTVADMRMAPLEKNRSALDARLASLGSKIVHETRIAHTRDAVAAALREALTEGADPILVFGASAITDRRDVVPAGIVEAGGTILHFGMPVDPGNLLLLGKHGATTIIGMPGCARSPRLNGFDFVLERVLAGLSIGPAEIAAMGLGGLLADIPARPQPREVVQEAGSHPPQIAAIVLAAGTSSRMGRNKLLVELDGELLVRRVARTVATSAAAPVIVVTGSDPERVRHALAGIAVTFVHNPDFREGLSASLRVGIRALPDTCAGVLVVLGDMPLISSALIDRMIAAFDPHGGRAICVAASSGKRGNPVLFDRRFFPDLLSLAGDIGAKHIVAENDELVCEIAADDDGPLIDIDTPESLEDFLAGRR